MGASSSYPALAKYKDGELVELTITSTLIKTLFSKGNEKPVCPHKVYQTYLTGNHSNPPTDAMANGLYFESCALGKGRSGSLFDLPRLKSGQKSVDHLRIDEQVKMFSLVAERYGIMIIKEGKLCNVQVEQKTELRIDALKNHSHIKFFLMAGLDIVSPISVPKTDIQYPMAAIDLKLTKDRDNEHGEFCWGLPQYLDPIQGVFYSFITGFPFFYLLFDYKAKNRGHKLLPLITMALFPNGLEKEEDRGAWELAKQREVDLRVIVPRTAETIIKWDTEKYPKEPSYEECERCPMNPVYPGGTCDSVNHIKRM